MARIHSDSVFSNTFEITLIHLFSYFVNERYYFNWKLIDVSEITFFNSELLLIKILYTIPIMLTWKKVSCIPLKQYKFQSEDSTGKFV